MDGTFLRAASLLAPGLRLRAERLPESVQRAAEEIRLRRGRTPTVNVAGRERPIDGGAPATEEELAGTLEICACASLYARERELGECFLSAPGGCRVGLCGRAVCRDGRMESLAEISSLCIRIARAHPCAEGLPELLTEGGALHSALILSPPGLGKTTLLRDAVRRLSEAGVRMAVADERGELAAVADGHPGFDLGPCTDVLTGCPKAQAVWRLARCMAPQGLAVDEITAPEDVRAVSEAAGMGVALLASAHGRGPEDLRRRPLYRRLLTVGVFDRLVVIGPGHRWAPCPLPTV